MANALPDLVINIAANTATLTDGIGKASAQIGAFATTSTASLNRIAAVAETTQRVLGTLGVGLSVAGIVAFTKGVVESANALQDLATTTGASVESLSRMQNVATVSGAGVDEFQTIITKTAVAVGSMGDSTKRSTQALQFLGVSAKDPADALQQIADKMAQYADGAGKAALAVDLFGKTGASFIPVLDKMANSQGIVATTTAEQAKQAQELSEQLRLLAVSATTLKNAVLGDLVPALAQMVEQFNLGRAAGLGFFDALNNTTQTKAGLETRITELSEKINSLRESLSRTPQGTPAFLYGSKDLETYTKQLGVLLEVQQRATAASKSWLDSFKPQVDYKGAADGVDQAAKAAADYVAQLQKEAAALGLTDIAAKALALDSLPKLTAAQKAAGTAALNAINTFNVQAQASKAYYQSIDDGIKAYEDGLRASAASSDQATASSQSLLDTLTAQNATFGESAIALERYTINQKIATESAAHHGDAVLILIKSLQQLDQIEAKTNAQSASDAAAKAADDLTRQMTRAAQQIDDVLSSAISDAIFGSGRDAAEDLKRAMEQMFSQLVLRPLLQPIASSIVGSVLGTGGVGGSLASLAGLGGGLAGGISGLFGPSNFTAALAGDAYLPGALAGGGTSAGFGSLAGGLLSSSSFIPLLGTALALFGASGLFNKSPSQVSGQFGVSSGTGGFEDNAFTSSPFGNLGFLDAGTQQFSGQAAQAFNQVVGGALAAFATRLSASQQTDLAGKLQGTSFAGTSGTFTTEDFLQKYGATVLKQVIGEAFDELNPALAAVAKGFDGTADQVSQFANGLLGLYDITSKLPTTIQSGLIAALDETQDTLTRITAIAGAYKAVQDTLNADPIADAQAQILANSNNLYYAFQQQGSALDTLVSKFDGSTDAANGLASATASYYQAEVALIASLKQASATIDTTIAGAERNIKLSTLDSTGKGNFLADESNSLLAQIYTATDPSQINSLVSQITANTAQSFDLLSPDQQKQREDEFIAYLDKLDAAAQGRIDTLTASVQQQAATEDDKLRGMLTDFITKMGDAGATQQAAANTQLAAARTPITVTVNDARAPEVNGG